MKRRPSTPQPEPQEGLPNATAIVSITEVPPDADKLKEWAKEDPGGVSKLVIKQSVRLLEAKRAAEKRAAVIAPLNEETKQDAKERRGKIREVARELGRPTRKRLQSELLKRGLSVSIKTISRARNPKK
jgi:hypothetical protein